MSEEIGELIVKIGADIAGFKESMLLVGELTAAAFATKEIVDLGIEGAKATAIQDQFNYIVGKKGPEALEALKQATLGTISNVSLMADANQAAIRGIDADYLPLLGKLTIQLQQTGDSTLTFGDTINAISRVIQTGRTQGLVPLGIDVAKLKEELAGVTDEGQKTSIVMGAVAEASLKMRAPTENAATSVDQLHTMWTNFKDDLGKNIAPAIVDSANLIEHALNPNKDVEDYIAKQKAGYEAFIIAYKAAQDAAAKSADTLGNKASEINDILGKQLDNNQKAKDTAFANWLIAIGVKDVNADNLAIYKAQYDELQRNLQTQKDITHELQFQKAITDRNNAIISSIYLNVDTETGGQYMGGQPRAISTDGGKTYHAPGDNTPPTVIVNTYNDTTAKLQYKGV